MRCYFVQGGHIAGVEVLELYASDADAIQQATLLFREREGSFEGFEVWDLVRPYVSPPAANARRSSVSARRA